MDQIAEIQKNMANLYIMFCLPLVIIHTDTGKVEITHEWVNDQAQKTFEQLQDVLQHHLVRLNQYSMNRIKS